MQVVVVPQMMKHGGINPQQAVTGFILGTIVGSSLVGFLSNLPIPAGPGLGCAAFYAYGLVFNLTPQSERGGHIAEGQSFNPVLEDTVTPVMGKKMWTVVKQTSVANAELHVALQIRNVVFCDYRFPQCVTFAQRDFAFAFAILP
eukprot:SAG31_NODE_14090_length_828_cov_0.622771_1_plen_144_part_10